MKTIALIFALAFLAIGVAYGGVCGGCSSGGKDQINYIDKDQLRDMMKSADNLQIIDVLPSDSYAKGHIKGAISIPLPQLKDELGRLDKNKPTVVYCASARCRASVKAARILMNAGFKNVSDYKNGIAEWKEENLPLGKSE